MFADVLHGIGDALELTNLMFIALGVLLGIVVGAIPGLNGPMAIAIAVPLTYYMSPLAAITFLIGINKGGTYGGSITAILLNTPGSPEAAATAFDGYPLARQGKAEKAMKMALYSHVFGDTFSDIVLIVVAAPLAVLALMMGPAEVTAVLFFALTFVAALSGNSLVKGLIAAAIGVFLSAVGLDPETATPRLTFGLIDLERGIPLISMAIGLLALSEIIIQIEEHIRTRGQSTDVAVQLSREASREDRRVSFAEFRDCFRTIMRSTLIGTGIGALPGIGSVVAGFLSYGIAKRVSKHPETFGKGELEGVAACEAACSAVVGANLIPLFTLGIPGNLAAAMLIGAFIIHGLTPGPLLFKEQARLIYGIYATMMIANLLNLVIGGLGLRVFAQVAKIPARYLFPIIVLLCVVGSYVADNGMFAVGVTLVFAVLGYLMRKLDYSFVTFVIGFVLGSMFELSLRQTLILFRDRPAALLEHPIAAAFMLLSLWFIWRFSRGNQQAAAPQGFTGPD